MRSSNVFENKNILASTLLRKTASIALTTAASFEKFTINSQDYSKKPPVIVNSLPKSGTHLLLQVTRALPEIRYFGRFIAEKPSLTEITRSTKSLTKKISKILPSETLGAHVTHSSQLKEAMLKINALHLFIYRDPRAVILSEIHYLTYMNKWHRMHNEFKRLSNFSSRLDLALFGHDERYPDANYRMLGYAPWINDPEVIAVRYEDLAGENQYAELERIIKLWSKRSQTNIELNTIVSKASLAINPSRSHTFRAGGAETWRTTIHADDLRRLTKHLMPSLQAFEYIE